MKCKCKRKFAGNKNQSYRSVIKILLPKEQTEVDQSMCAAMNVFFH